MSDFEQMMLAAMATFIASSSGFWIYLKHRIEAKDANTKLLLGLAHDKIVYFGMQYIEKGFVTKDEYDDLLRYFYEPYISLGGNGTAERIMRLVQRLPLTLENSRIAQIADNARLRAEDEHRERMRLETSEELYLRKRDTDDRESEKRRSNDE